MIGKYVVKMHRVAHLLYKKRVPVLPKLIQLSIFLLSSCEISYRTQIGRGLKLPHPTGIVIAGGAVIGNNVTINQHVTIGGNWGKKKNGRAFPIISSNVWIMPDSIVVGPIEIDESVVIGAKSLVTKSVPSNSMVAGNPARIIRELTDQDLSKLYA